MTPPPRSASIKPRLARSIASLRLLSAIRSRRAYRTIHLVLKMRTPYPNAINYSTQHYNVKRRFLHLVGEGVTRAAAALPHNCPPEPQFILSHTGLRARL